MRPFHAPLVIANLLLSLGAALIGPVSLLTVLPLLTPTSHAQAVPGGTVNIPGVGRVTVNADGTITLPGGATARLNADGTVTLPGGQIVTPGGGGGGGGGGVVVPPTTTTDPRIVAANGVLVGADATAAVLIPGAIIGGGGGATAATYLWSITGGRFTDANLTRATVNYTADAAGTAKLACLVTVSGVTPFTATADVTVVDPTIAGTITTPPTTAAVTTATGTATLPPAQNADRTFRWTVSGTAARITAGAATNEITFVPGDAGVKELTCIVTFTALQLPVTLRAFVVVQGSGPSVALTVNGGFGGGTYPGGSRVDIFAATPSSGQVFDRWTGDTAALDTGPLAPFVAHTLLTLPATSVTLTATYKAAPAWTPLTVAAFNPQPFTPAGAGATPTTVSAALAYYIPPGATALVFLLHDTGGAAADWFTAPESALLLRELVSAGYGVAALGSFNRTNRAWNTQALLANNPDALNHVAALNKFAADGLLPATRPVFLLGLAAGADIAARYAELLATASPARPIRGTVLYCASGNETASVVSRVPALYLLAKNDSALAANGAKVARTNSQLLAGRGLPTAVIDNLAAPLHPGRFRALGITDPAFTNADASAIWTAVKNAGLIDANNYVKAIPTDTALGAAIPATYQSRRADVAAQLTVAYAEQAFFADANARALAWLAARVAGTAAPAAGRLVNLSTRLKLAAAGENLTFGFTLTGTEKATVLIRGIGPTLGAFGVPGTLPAPRLEVRAVGQQALLAANEAWDKSPVTAASATAIATAAASVGAFALAPGSADCAVLLSLSPGGYTATFLGVNGATGEVLAEIYDVTKNTTRLTNLATLAHIDNEGDLVTAGITIVGNQPRTLIVRGVGPGLTELGVPGALADPTLTVLSSATASVAAANVAANNNWGTGGSQAALTAAFPAVGAFPLKTGSADAALIYAFTAGGYSVQASAATATANQPNPPAPTGLLLIEVYEAP
jgi:hypothetical protein